MAGFSDVATPLIRGPRGKPALRYDNISNVMAGQRLNIKEGNGCI